MAPGTRKTPALTWRWTVDADSAGQRADRAIARAFESGLGEWSADGRTDPPSRNQVQRLIDEGSVMLNDEPIRSSVKLDKGARIAVTVPPPRPLELIPEDRPIDILFQDEHLLVINKPPGLTVHPSETQSEGTLVHALLHHVRDLSGIGGVMRPGIVHRIDKDTSGALVVTKTDAAHRALTEVFAKHEIERRYWAICYDSPGLRPEEEKIIESLIGRNPNDRKKMSMTVEEGRRAVTHVRELEAYFSKAPGKTFVTPFASLMEARLETGRTHQVRVHLTGMGHSLLGDRHYGVPTERHPKWTALPSDVRRLTEAMPGQALHARILGFQHPITGVALRFEAEPPPAFAALLAAIRTYQSKS